MADTFHKPAHYPPALQNMYKTNLHKAIEAVPKFEDRISLLILDQAERAKKSL